jgi:glycosidase
MDPDGDGNPADGVDGWLLSLEEGALRPFDAKQTAFWDRWREAVQRINPKAVAIGSGPLALARIAKGPFDIALNESLASAIQYFFSPANQSAAVKDLFDAIDSVQPPSPLATRAGNLTLASSAGRAPRLLSTLAERDRSLLRGRNASPGLMPDDDAHARWRLATIFQHFCLGAPATYYGDEVGMYGGSGAFVNPPMWWKDAPESAARSTHYRDDFFALVQWLHHMREWYEPLRRGDFRRVLADDANKVLAFARSLPGDEIILVMNYGARKQKVMLPAGKPGQLVAVFSPQVQPSEKRSPRKANTPEAAADTEKVEPLGVGGSRQFVNPEGKIRIWVAPMSVRVVFVNDKEPRR